MKDWRVHFIWAIVAALGAVVSARMASRPDPRPPALVVRSGALRSRERSSPSHSPSASTPELPPQDPANAAPRLAPPLGDLPVEDRIRALIKTSENWNEFQEAMKDLTDRETKLKLAREAFAGKNLTSVGWFINVLRVMKGRDVAEILESYLKIHPAADDAAVAAGALGDVGDPGSLAPLQEALHSKNEEVRFAGARSLWQLGYRAPMEEMMSTLSRQYESSDGGVRREAIERIADLDPSAVLPLLARALRDSNSDVRLAAVQAFWTLGGPEYAAYLEPLLNDSNARVAKQARELVEAMRKEGK